MTTSIHHVAITAPDEILQQVLSFYDLILGLKPGPRPDFGGFVGYWLYSADQPIIHLLEDANRDGTKSGYFDHFALRCTDIAGVVSRLEANGIEFHQLEMQELGQTQLFLLDPSGTSLELNFIHSDAA